MSAPDSGGTLAVSTFRSIAKALDELGLPTTSIYEAAGLERAVLLDDDARVPVSLEHRV